MKPNHIGYRLIGGCGTERFDQSTRCPFPCFGFVPPLPLPIGPFVFGRIPWVPIRWPFYPATPVLGGQSGTEALLLLC